MGGRHGPTRVAACVFVGEEGGKPAHVGRLRMRGNGGPEKGRWWREGRDLVEPKEARLGEALVCAGWDERGG